MKILATTHGSSLRLMLLLSAALQGKHKHDLSLIISDSSEYKAALKQADLAATIYKCNILKEWELFERSRYHHCSIKETGYWEKELQEPLTWTALADKSLHLGKHFKYTQDYSPDLDTQRVNQITSYAYKAIDQFFYEEKPDVILTFGSGTYCEYISAKISEKQKIPLYILKPVLTDDSICLHSSLYEWPEAIWEKFNKTSHLLEAGSMKMESIERATEFVEKIRDDGLIYEKTPRLSSPSVEFNISRAIKTVSRSLVQEIKKRQDKDMRIDHYQSGYFLSALYAHIAKPWKAWRVGSFLKEKCINADKLEGGHRRIYYPLQCETETIGQISEGPYHNQIELLRLLSRYSPADCEILVQESAGVLGYRSISYYRKILDIPKVKFLQPNLKQSQAIALCNAVAVVDGNIGFKAAIQGKPVLVLGKPPYRHVGEPYFFVNNNPWKLHKTIEQVFAPENAEKILREGEEKFIRLLTVIHEESCFVKPDTLAIGKGRNRCENRFNEHIDRSQQFERLVEYLAERLMPSANTEVEEKVA